MDVLIGPNFISEGLAVKEYARDHPEVTFVATSPAQALTLYEPVSNLFKFGPDGAQLMAGLGAYAYHDLGWRTAVTIADDQSVDYTQVAGFVAEFCALGGTVEQVWVPSAQQSSPSYYAQLPKDADGYVAAGFILTVLGFVNGGPRSSGQLGRQGRRRSPLVEPRGDRKPGEPVRRGRLRWGRTRNYRPTIIRAAEVEPVRA